MPLIRLKDDYLEQEDGVRFLMADELGNTVACKVSHEALRAHTERVPFAGTDSASSTSFPRAHLCGFSLAGLVAVMIRDEKASRHSNLDMPASHLVWPC